MANRLFAIDITIAFALSLSVAFLLVVMECCRTNGELTRAELDLMRPPSLATHSAATRFKT